MTAPEFIVRPPEPPDEATWWCCHHPERQLDEHMMLHIDCALCDVGLRAACHRGEVGPDDVVFYERLSRELTSG